MKILHYMPRGQNMGDNLIDLATKKFFLSLFPDAEIFSFSSHPFASFCSQMADLREYDSLSGVREESLALFGKPDLIVVGGAPFWGSSAQAVFDSPAIRKSEAPVVFFGAGTKPYGNKETAQQRYKAFISNIEPLKELIIAGSARDEATAERMRTFGLQNVFMTGCPVAHYLNEPIRWKSDSGYFIIAFRHSQIPSHIQITREFILKLEKELGARHLIVFHEYDEIRFAEEKLWKSHFKKHNLNYISAYNAGNLIPFYRNAKFVLSYRVHGTLLASTVGTPFLHINMDGRGADYAGTFDPEGEIMLTASDSLRVDDIIEKVKYLLHAKDAYDNYYTRIADARKNMERFGEYIKPLIG